MPIADAPSERVWVVLPMRRRLPVENGWTYCAVDPPGVFAYRIELFHVPFVLSVEIAVPDAAKHVYANHLSPRFVEDEQESGVVDEAISDDVRVGEAKSNEPTEQSTTESPPSSHETTWAIVCVPLDHPTDGDERDETRMNVAFDSILESANEALHGFSILIDINDGPVAEVRSEDLHFPIPMHVGVPEHPDGSGSIEYLYSYGMLPRSISHLSRTTTPPKDVDSDAARDSITQIRRSTPFGHYSNLRRKAIELLDARGDHQMAGIVVGIAGEVLLDSLLHVLMWEEGKSPIDASDQIGDMPLKARVTSLYHSRIFGIDWSCRTGPIADFFEKAVYLRNRLAHAGSHAGYEEVSNALGALLALERALGDALADDQNRTRFMRTAILYCGKRGLARRLRLSRRVANLMSSPDEPDWARAMHIWNLHYIRHRQGAPTPGKGRIKYLADIEGTNVNWYAIDIDAGFAAQIDDPSIFFHSAVIQAVRDAAAQTTRTDRQRCTLAVRDDLLESQIESLSWKRDFELLPDFRVW